MQKKDPKYYELKEETAWTMEQFKYLLFFKKQLSAKPHAYAMLLKLVRSACFLIALFNSPTMK